MENRSSDGVEESNRLVKHGENLAKGVVVYFIGTFVSRLLQFLILPIITVVISADDYGMYDLIISIAGLIIPLITLQTFDAALRYMYDADDEESEKILSTVTTVITWGLIITGVAILLIHNQTTLLQEPIIIWLYIVTITLYQLLQRVCRAQKLTTEFAISGIINTLFLLGTQILLVVIFRLTIQGLLLSNVISCVAACLYLLYKVEFVRYISFSAVNKEGIQKVISFSLPLVPNSISLWMVSSVNRLIIISTLGSSANGVFAIANKFPALLMIATGVFQLAWQESAISIQNTSEQNEFNNKTFHLYTMFIFSTCFVLLPIIRILMPVMTGPEFEIGWIYIPALLYGTAFCALAMFLGAGYISTGNTGGAFWTTMVGASINIVFCLLFVQKWGLQAMSVGTLLGFIMMFFVRKSQMKGFFPITMPLSTLAGIFGGMAVTAFLYYSVDIHWQFVNAVAAIGVFGVCNRQLVSIGKDWIGTLTIH